MFLGQIQKTLYGTFHCFSIFKFADIRVLFFLEDRVLKRGRVKLTKLVKSLIASLTNNKNSHPRGLIRFLLYAPYIETNV